MDEEPAKANATDRPAPENVEKVFLSRAERSAENLRQHYERGQRALDRSEMPGQTYRPAEFAKEHNVSVDTLRKEKKFAERYSREEFDELCGVGRNGRSLHWGHVIYLILIKDGEQRRDLQQQAAEQGWSAPEMRRQVSRLRSSQNSSEGDSQASPGGRPLRVYATVGAAMEELIEQTRIWVRRAETGWASKEGELLEVLKRRKLTKQSELRQLADEALAQVLAMQQHSAELAMALQAILTKPKS
jgi:hypothetical protein